MVIHVFLSHSILNMLKLEQLKRLHSENTPRLSILSIHIGSLSFQVKTTLCWGCNYESMNVTILGASVKGYRNFYICITFKSSSVKMASGMQKNPNPLLGHYAHIK